MTKHAFFSTEYYPEVEVIRKEWKGILDEARQCRKHMIWIEDERTRGKVWAFAPLQAEEEDRDARIDALSTHFRTICPLTVKVIKDVPDVFAYGFSLLLAGGQIAAHRHTNPFVTAMFGLSVGDWCYITVEKETRKIKPGSVLIFDYTLSHEISNQGEEDRLVLLVLLKNKFNTKLD